jgi:S-formylglutathione hydrolase FrmB
MPRRFRLFLAVLLVACFTAAAQNRPLRFRVTLAKELAAKPAAGRLFVLMTDSPQDRELLSTGFGPSSTWLSAMEVASLAPGQTFEFNPDIQAFPHRFSEAKPGTCQFMALLDPDHSYAYTGRNEGDLYGPVRKVADLDPANTPPIDLLINKRTEALAKLADTDDIKLVELQSARLTAFWGRPIKMRAGVVLPASYSKVPSRRYPTVYRIHGYGGNHRGAWSTGPGLIKQMSAGRLPEMVHVFLDGSLPTGHHEFADSVNNGPWGSALNREFIPYLEKKFPLVARPGARFLTGHSSGGWSSLWLQITYPDFFGGAWSTSPDPVDLRSFTGVDVSVGSTVNAYRTRDGQPRNLIRRGGRDLISLEDFAKQEEVQGEYGGQFASFEWVWSPKGQDGRPMKLFNRVTGELDPEVQQAWQKYDIRLVLEKNWTTLGPKLRGKINVICGAEDTFHLEEAVSMLCDFFKRAGSDAVCEIVPGRDHMNLFSSYKTYPNGLAQRIAKEMQARFEAARKASEKKP